MLVAIGRIGLKLKTLPNATLLNKKGQKLSVPFHG
jgi:hypothetical protein